MQGLILAAGRGSRLKELTADRPKCMVCIDGITLIERTLRSLDRLGLSRIVIVDGYCGDMLRAYVASLGIKTAICYIRNPVYDSTNNIYSLYLAEDALCADDTLLLESDIIFDDAVLRCLYDDVRPDLVLAAKYEDWMDGTCLVLDGNDGIRRFIFGKAFDEEEKYSYYKTVNIYKFSKKFSQELYMPEMKKYRKRYGDGEYYEAALGALLEYAPESIWVKRLPAGMKWYEVDTAVDLANASRVFQ